MIAIIDYGMGNLRSVEKALELLGYPVEVTSDPMRVSQAKGVILPGVGAFADAMKNLTEKKLVPVIKETVAAKKPFLGICLGLQLMFTESEENGIYEGLDIFRGRVKRIPAGAKVPHMGWNQITIQKESTILTNIPSGSNFYFVHSYYVDPEDKEIITTTTEYNNIFTSICSEGNTFGIQFHPEKSSRLGLEILKNFGQLVMEVEQV
ncbi:MAG: imidazole glycerol phosphate synthase subunit HisH [Bacillota bacterium]|nr:imidazole glycerol phosphate synthase subunit HisH [Bacillota bacterium]